MKMKATSVCFFYITVLFPVVKCVGENNSSMLVNCSLYANVSDVKTLQRALDSHKLLLRLTVSIAGDTGPFSDPVPGDLFRTDQWVMAIGDTGKAFLQLHDEFELMPLYMMSFSVQHANIHLHQSSDNCLQNFTLAEIETKFRKFFLNLLDVPLTTTINVCNRRIIQGDSRGLNDGYNGDIIFSCCVQDSSGIMSCENQKPGHWFNVLIPLKVFITFFLVLYLGILLPSKKRSSFFKLLEYIFIDCECVNTSYCCILRTPLKMNMSLLRPGHSNLKCPKQKGFKQFNELLNDLNQGSAYQLEVDAVSVSVEKNYDISDGIPIPGFFQYLVDVIVMFPMHIVMFNMKATRDGKDTCGGGNVICAILKFFIIIIAMFPIIIRVIFYFKFEKSLLDTYLDAVNKKGYKDFSVSDVKSRFFTIVFDILGIFSLPIFTFVYQYSVEYFQTENEQTPLERKIKRAYSLKDRFDCFGKRIILKIVCQVLLFIPKLSYWIMFKSPTFRVLWITMFALWKEGHIWKICLYGLFVLVSQTVTLICLIDVILFYIYCLTYVAIGVLLNYDHVASYVSFVIVFCLFCIISINSARKPFTFFNKIFINTVNEYCEKNIDFDSFKRVEGYRKAFLCSKSNKLGTFLGSSNNTLEWVVPSELLFFEFADDSNYSNYSIHVSRRFMKKMLYSKHQFSPRSKLYWMYLIAIRNMFAAFIIFCFLLAVTLAFAGGSSPGIITLFTFVSGFSVVSVKKLCSRSPRNKEIGQWKALFEQELDTEVKLRVSDIHVSKVHTLNNWSMEDEDENTQLYIKKIRYANGKTLYEIISHEERQTRRCNSTSDILLDV